MNYTKAAKFFKKGHKMNVGEKNPMFGKHHTEKSREKIKQARLGKKRPPFSEEWKRKLRLTATTKGKHWKVKDTSKMKGRKQSKETIEKRVSKMRGEKSHFWKGGKSFKLYGFEWTKLLKHSIRTRDCFVCQMCKKNGWIVHHIDYNKKNCDPKNLITLCRSCHAKTNFNREHWVDYFKIYAT